MAGLKPLLETVGALLPRIKAWHTSPYDFEKFDISKLRTGQGAASYGEGIYKAESPKVSGVGGEYWDEFARRTPRDSPEQLAQHFLKDFKFDREAASVFANALEGSYLTMPKEVVQQAARLLSDPKAKIGPRVYEVGIHAKPSQILDWDAPLSAQPSKPLERIDPQLRSQLDDATAGPYGERNPISEVPEEYTGRDFYKALVHPEVEVPIVKKGGDTAEPSFQVMDYLNAIDLPVTRYLDQHSRSRVAPKSYYDALATAKSRLWQAEQKGAPQWELQHLKQSVDEADARVRREKAAFPQTRNYVTRDTDFLEILRKLAIPGMVGGAATAYQPQGQQ